MDVLNIRDKKYLTDLVASVAGQAVARSIDVVAASVVVTGTTLRALRTPSAIRAWIGAHFSLSGAEVDKEIKGVGWNGRKETKNKIVVVVKMMERKMTIFITVHPLVQCKHLPSIGLQVPPF